MKKVKRTGFGAQYVELLTRQADGILMQDVSNGTMTKRHRLYHCFCGLVRTVPRIHRQLFTNRESDPFWLLTRFKVILLYQSVAVDGIALRGTVFPGQFRHHVQQHVSVFFDDLCVLFFIGHIIPFVGIVFVIVEFFQVDLRIVNVPLPHASYGMPRDPIGFGVGKLVAGYDRSGFGTWVV